MCCDGTNNNNLFLCRQPFNNNDPSHHSDLALISAKTRCQYKLQVTQLRSVHNTVTIKRDPLLYYKFAVQPDCQDIKVHCYYLGRQPPPCAKDNSRAAPSLSLPPSSLCFFRHQLPSWIAHPAYEPVQLITNLYPHSTTPHVKSWEEDICHRHGRR